MITDRSVDLTTVTFDRESRGVASVEGTMPVLDRREPQLAAPPRHSRARLAAGEPGASVPSGAHR